jgi:predicted transcriptional regulator
MNRNFVDISADILSITKTDTGKTKIMSDAKLSYSLVQKYLKMLIDAKLIGINANKEYLMTAKGEEFLTEYKKVQEHINQAQNLTNDLNTQRLELSKLL